MFQVKIYYKNNSHKYANLFETKEYELGKQIGSIVKYRRMNWLERFIFRNCM